LAKAYIRTKLHFDPSSRLATIDMCRKLGAVPPFCGGTGSPSNTKSPGPRPTYTPSGILIHQPLGHNGHGPQIGGGCPHQTLWPGPRPTCMASFILIRPTVWPQYTNVTDRTGQTGPFLQRAAILALQALY